MAFNPGSNEQIVINGKRYAFSEHPHFPGMPYGQEGRQGTVYKLKSLDTNQFAALKVFRPIFRLPSLVYLSEQLDSFSKLEGLKVCAREVITPQKNMELLGKFSELLYSVQMPWIDGPTWMDVLLDKRELSAESSLHAALSLAKVLSLMEQRGLAHCDLSSPNILLPGLLGADQRSRKDAFVELVDVEQLYAGSLDKPEHLPGGSPGYTPVKETVQPGWHKYADRYAGGILLAEMLSWFHPRIREQAWGESYFDPNHPHGNEERKELMLQVLIEQYGDETGALFQQTWNCDDLHQCPTFGDWFVQLSSKSSLPLEDVLEEAASAPSNPIAEAKTGAEQGQQPVWTDEALKKARSLEQQGYLADALEAYNRLYTELPKFSSIRKEVEFAITDIKAAMVRQQSTEAVKPAGTKQIKLDEKQIYHYLWLATWLSAAAIAGISLLFFMINGDNSGAVN